MKIKTFFTVMTALLALAGCGKKAAPAPAADPEKIVLPGGSVIEMVKIAPGSFKPNWDLSKLAPELQKSIRSSYQGEIVLTRPYWIGKYEVTQAQYRAVSGNNPGTPVNDALPVNNISRKEAKAFCAELNRLYAGKLPAGYQFDLPSEAQWEFAAHAGNSKLPGYGNMSDHAWIKENCRTPQLPGKKLPNCRGIYDLAGNVAELCRDYYADHSTRFVTGKMCDPVNEYDGSEATIRGGSFLSSADEALAPIRQVYRSEKALSVGFRLALVPIEKPIQRTIKLTLANNSQLELVCFPMADESNYNSSFWMSKYEITQEVFEAVMGYNPSKIKGKNHPVDSVSHDEALEFCEKLTELFYHQLPDQYLFYLPFEYMWEYACRAGTTSPYNCGYDSATEKFDLNEFIRHKGNSGKSHHPAGEKRPNAMGMYDMHGNVREWCFHTGTADEAAVIRGGGWKDELSKCTSDHKEKVKADHKSDDLGFRIVMVKQHVPNHY